MKYTKDRFRDFCWPHQVERPRTGWVSHFRWIAHMWLLLVFRDKIGLGLATSVAFDYLEEALTRQPFHTGVIVVDAYYHPITVTLPPAKPGMEYWIQNIGRHPVTVEASGRFSSLEVKGDLSVKVVKRNKSGWRVRR